MDTAPIHIADLGLIGFAAAENLQREASEIVASGGPARLFLLEHPPTITFGRNGGEEHLPLSPSLLAERGVALEKTSRGGSITCHFPGQLVAYPVMRLDRRSGGLRLFFHDMEESVIRTLARLGVEAERKQGRPGVWVASRKICSIGIAVKRWISTHGLSLNIASDLSLFTLVAPCGLPGVSATSVHLEQRGEPVGMHRLKTIFVREFCEIFHMDPVHIELPRAVSTAPGREPGIAPGTTPGIPKDNA